MCNIVNSNVSNYVGFVGRAGLYRVWRSWRALKEGLGCKSGLGWMLGWVGGRG